MDYFGTTGVQYFNHGTVGENLVVAKDTFSLSNVSHTDKAPLMTMQTISGALRSKDITSKLNSVQIVWSDTGATPTLKNLRLLIFAKANVPATVTVGTALAVLQADADYLIADIPIATTGYNTINEICSQTVTVNATLYNLDTIQGTNVYFTLINNAGHSFTPSTGEKISLMFNIVQN